MSMCKILALLAIATVVFAQVPRIMNYQGKLTNSTGIAITGIHDLNFSIYNVPAGGTPLWTEEHTGINIDHGLFSILLGEINPLNLPFDETYWMEVSVDGTSLMPRVRFTSSSYAFRAAIADSLAGTVGAPDGDWQVRGDTMYAIPTGNVGIGTTSPNTRLHVLKSPGDGSIAKFEGEGGRQLVFSDGSIWEEFGLINQLDQIIAAGDISDANKFTYGDGLIVVNDGNVGIGTATPDARLLIENGPASLRIGSQLLDDFPNIRGVSTSNADWTVGFSEDMAGTGLVTNGPFPLLLGTGDVERMRIDLSGNVGIGTSSPAYKLDVNGDVRISNVPDDAVHDSVLTIDGGQIKKVATSEITSGNYWTFSVTDGNDSSLVSGGQWGISRAGNTRYGNADSTHVNLGVACTTGTSGENNKYCTVGGGAFNHAKSFGATVGGGCCNSARYNATVGGGEYNTASGIDATVGGGASNTASGIVCATVGGGASNTASADYATVGGGRYNTASGNYATVGGGYGNEASGSYATIPGGYSNRDSADYSLVFGQNNLLRETADYSVMFGLNDTLGDDSTFFIGLPYALMDNGHLHIYCSAGEEAASFNNYNPDGFGLYSYGGAVGGYFSSENEGIAVDIWNDEWGSAGSRGIFSDVHSEYGRVNYGVLSIVSDADTNYAIFADAYGGTKNWAGYFGNGNVYIRDKLGIGTTDPAHELHLEGSDTFYARVGNGVAYFKNTAASGTGEGAVYGECNNIAGDGFGGCFKGGFLGVQGMATLVGSGNRCGVDGWASGGGNDNHGLYGEAFGDYGTKYGVYGNANGSGTNYGVYGYAYGGTTNWAGYFSGNGYFSGKVGIGTTSPATKLDVAGEGSFHNAAGGTAVGNDGANSYVDIRNNSGGQPYIDFSNDGTSDFDGRIMLSGDDALFIDGCNVGIGTASPGSYKLYVNGDAAKPGGGSWSDPSDIRLKENIEPYRNGLSEVVRINPITYNYSANNPLGLPSDRIYIGVFAQEVQEVIPEAVEQMSNGYLAVNNDAVIWAMLNAIKELSAANDSLKARIEALEKGR